MPNICSYGMQVKGKAENVEEFIKMIQVNYAFDDNGNCYNPDNNKPVERHLWRVFDAYVDEDITTGNIRKVYISGSCAWSVLCCMFDGEHTYQNSNPNAKGTTIPIESARLQLTIEIFSEECGMCFMEHFVVVDGCIIINECVDYNEYCTEDYESVEEMNENCGTSFTQEEFDEGGWISVGGMDWEFDQWS